MTPNGVPAPPIDASADLPQVRTDTDWRELYAEQIARHQDEIREIKKKEKRVWKIAAWCGGSVLAVLAGVAVLFGFLPVGPSPAESLSRPEIFLIIVQAVTLVVSTLIAVLSFMRASVAGNKERAREQEFELTTRAIEAQRSAQASQDAAQRAGRATVRRHIGQISNHLAQLDGLIRESDDAEGDQTEADGTSVSAWPRIRIPESVERLVDSPPRGVAGT